MKLLLICAFIILAFFAWVCVGPLVDTNSSSPADRPPASTLFGKEGTPFEVEFTPEISVSEDSTMNVYWREANGVRRIDVVTVERADGTPSGAFLVEPTAGASEQVPGRRCRWSFTLDNEFYTRCNVYTGGLTLDRFIDALLRLMDSRIESELVDETLAGREAVCVDVEGSGNLPEGFQVQEGRVCLGVKPNVPLYMANKTKALQFAATRVTAPLVSTEFERDVPDVPVVDPYPTIESLQLPESVEGTVIAFERR